jgi:hypothetical protein
LAIRSAIYRLSNRGAQATMTAVTAVAADVHRAAGNHQAADNNQAVDNVADEEAVAEAAAARAALAANPTHTEFFYLNEKVTPTVAVTC